MPYKDVEKRRARARAWAKENPERVAANSRKYLLKKRYSSEVTPEYFQLLFDRQDGKCAICKKEVLDKHLSIDHDHSTGAIRGLLCQKCNLALGLVEENTFILTDMVRYINAIRNQ